jgi:hypothetical protein
MELTDIEARLLNPEAGPVDVEFEHCLLTLMDALRGLSQPGGSGNYELQKQFCQELRNSKMIFENKIAHFYGSRYRGNTGGRILLDLADVGIALLRAKPTTEPKVLDSVTKHRGEIEKVDAALPRKATPALASVEIEAPVPA